VHFEFSVCLTLWEREEGDERGWLFFLGLFGIMELVEKLKQSDESDDVSFEKREARKDGCEGAIICTRKRKNALEKGFGWHDH